MLRKYEKAAKVDEGKRLSSATGFWQSPKKHSKRFFQSTEQVQDLPEHGSCPLRERKKKGLLSS
jgi:hypothetical protein